MEALVESGKHGHYSYEIWSYQENESSNTEYFYKILDIGGSQHYWLNDPVIRDPGELFESKGEARLAAIGHIELLEDGEG